jgi:hypothetical protein
MTSGAFSRQRQTKRLDQTTVKAEISDLGRSLMP